MLELPEACVLADQLRRMVLGRKIRSVRMNQSPHKFAFYTGDPESYNEKLAGKEFDKAKSYGGMVELGAEDIRLVFSDGVNLRFHEQVSPGPAKHQMLIEFGDGSALSGSVQMYGFLSCFKEGEYENQYRDVAQSKPSPLAEDFDESYFHELMSVGTVQKLSLKAFLATDQRIPGLGNGVLQDILWTAKLNPRRKVSTLGEVDKGNLFRSLKERLGLMTSLGGRDSEKDLFGKVGGYRTQMSNSHISEGCVVCGGEITKEAYLGGSVYYCPSCQKL